MPKPRQFKRNKPRKRFRGLRDDTVTVNIEPTEDGIIYKKRKDGSLYPRHTSISVTESTRLIYAELREAGKYPNYDELFLDIALQILKNERLEVFNESDKPFELSEDVVENLRTNIMRAKRDKIYRTRARKNAYLKRRYYRREVKTY